MKKHQYVQVGRPYLCRPQNPLALLWFLVVRHNRLRLSSLSAHGHRLVGTRALLRYLIQGTPSQPEFELPVRGTFCLPVHRGYKVFDLRRKSVTKVFSGDVSQALIDAEIENVRTAARLDFAPNMHRWNNEERWYEEDYVVGELGSQNDATLAEFLADYNGQVADCLEKTILLQDPLVAGFPEYVDEVLTILDDPRLTAPDLDPARVSRIREFMRTTADRLRGQRHRQMHLVFSHGDFSLQNIVHSKRGVKCIDWESARRRSLLYDLYNHFFTELHYGRVESDMLSEIDTAVRSMHTRLVKKSPSLSHGLLEAAPIYLRTYYIERVRTFLERDLSDHLLDVALQSISVFQAHDRALEQAGGRGKELQAGK